MRKCEEMKYEINKWEKDWEVAYDELEREKYERIRGERREMEEEIRKVRLRYENEIDTLNRGYEEKMMNLK